MILLGDLNWDWLSKLSDPFKDICDSLCLEQLINSPTRLNQKDPNKSSLIDVIFTNASHRFSASRVFCNDISDHCVIVCVRNCRIPKNKPHIILRRHFKRFNEQAFLQDIYYSDLHVVSLIPNVDLAWEYFKCTFFKYM